MAEAGAGRRQWPVGNKIDIHLGNRSRQTTTANTGVSGAAVLVSLVFVVVLITAPEQLDTAYSWIRDLPIVLEIIAWVLLLPWMLAHLAWESGWELWLRVVAVAVLVGGIALNFWRPSSG